MPCGVSPTASMVVTALSPTLSTGVTQERIGLAVDMHGAGAAQGHAAAELGAGHAEHVAQHPQQRRVAVDIDLMRCAVDLQRESHGCLSGGWG